MASVYSVTQINAYIKNMFSQDFALKHIFIKGEVSNCKYHNSGHIYFTLKDASGVLAAVMFVRQRSGMTFKMAEGQQVIVEGSINVYERDGKYQMYAKNITLDGAGDLYRRFEELRDRLEEMGMFAPEYKQEIPSYGTKIGIVTASTGAAIKDIMNISYRRNPYVQLYLYPALVQGTGSAYSIEKGIEALDRMELDTIIVARGGGSIEDLWAFNEEEVARAIFHCETPIISAVGHETDVTIADYVADMRAPTPSAGAELAVFEYSLFQERLLGCQRQMRRSVERHLREQQFMLENLTMRLKACHPEYQLAQKRQYLMELEDKMETMLKMHLSKERHRLEIISHRLYGLSPLTKLGAGYGYISTEDGEKITTIKQLHKGETFHLQLKDGSASASVLEKQEESV